MRIGLVSDTYTPQVNGVTTVVQRIAALLAAEGHEAAVVAPRYPGSGGPGTERELRLRSVAFPLYPDIRLSLPSFRPIARFFDAFKPDLLHVHTEGSLGLAGRRYARRRGLPLVTSFHTNFPAYSRHYGVGLLEPAVWRWLEWFHRPARFTLTPGEAVRFELGRRGIAHPVVWGRGVDTRFFHPGRRDDSWRRWLAGTDDGLILLHVGRLANEKGLDLLIQAWQGARAALGQRATFVIAGEGPMAKRIGVELPFARLLGFLPREQLATLYASADLCVFPSQTETCGLVALEAMAAGVAVVAADAGGFRESIRSSVTGVLIAPSDPQAYVTALRTLAADVDGRRALGKAARDYALTRDVAVEDSELLERYATLASVAQPTPSTCAA